MLGTSECYKDKEQPYMLISPLCTSPELMLMNWFRRLEAGCQESHQDILSEA